MILVIDNYDSFVFNLARHIGMLGRPRRVARNDAITLDDIAIARPEAIILSPGPKAPRDAGICLDIIDRFYREIPILGICLGHQCIGEAFGGQTVRAEKPVHGRASAIVHRGEEIFSGLPSPLQAGRYHSLSVELPAASPLTVTARLEDGPTIMGLSHPDWPVYGLQFHPESILTEYGIDMLRNFVALADDWNAERAAA